MRWNRRVREAGLRERRRLKVWRGLKGRGMRDGICERGRKMGQRYESNDKIIKVSFGMKSECTRVRKDAT